MLVNGASGAVGTYAVQLAKHFGAEVTGVCSGANVELVKALGAKYVIDYTHEDFTKSQHTYDIIFDTVAKTTFQQCQAALTDGGYYLNTVMPTAALVGGWYKLTTGKHVIGGNFAEKAEDLQLLKTLIESNALKPVIDRCYPLEQVAEAHRYVETGRKKGNVVLSIEGNAS